MIHLDFLFLRLTHALTGSLSGIFSGGSLVILSPFGEDDIFNQWY